MMHGKLVAIFLTPRAGEPMRQVDRAAAVAGQGLEGDRYAASEGTFSRSRQPEQQVTLIEAEAIEAAVRDCDVALEPGETRRNLITRNVPLNHLVGRTFTVGSVTIRGIRLCEPCGHLEKLTRKGVEASLVHRGGLRAEIVSGGELQPGDEIRASDE